MKTTFYSSGLGLKKVPFLFTFFIAFIISDNNKAQVITTVAGDGGFGFGGDGGQATAAEFSYPTDVDFDSVGNMYIVDNVDNRIREVNVSTGIITTTAGNGIRGYGGDSGPATDAELYWPIMFTIDSKDNIYIADNENSRIRKIDALTGIITTIAGDSIRGYNGDGIQATSAELNYPFNVAVDIIGNIYIADEWNNRIRKVTASTGIINTVAGNGVNGYSGDGGQATLAELKNHSGEMGVAIDDSGNIFIADAGNNRIRKVIVSTGIITTIAGNGMQGYSGDGGLATSAELYAPCGLAFNSSGELYISDTYNNRIRKVNISTGNIYTIAGNGIEGYNGDGGNATNAELNVPIGIRFDVSGSLYIGDQGNGRIRKVINPTGIETIKNSSYLTVYPNPANQNIYIDLQGNDVGKSLFKLFNITGQLVWQGCSDKITTVIPVSKLGQGIYFLKALTNNGETLTQKVSIIR